MKTTIIDGNSNDKDNVRVLLLKGEKGDTGDTGPANSLSIGTVAKGDNASATITGDAPSQTLNLVLPKGDKGDTGNTGAKGEPGDVSNGQIYYQANDTINVGNEYNTKFLYKGYKASASSLALVVPTKKMINNENIGISVSTMAGTLRKPDGTLIGTADTNYKNVFSSFSAFPYELDGGNAMLVFCVLPNGSTLLDGISDFAEINFFANDLYIVFSSIS